MHIKSFYYYSCFCLGEAFVSIDCIDRQSRSYFIGYRDDSCQ